MNNEKEIDRMIEACMYRHHNDCRQIEDRQDAIKRQRYAYEEIQEQMHCDGRHVHDRLNTYVGIKNIPSASESISMSNQIVDASGQINKCFSDQLDDLSTQERRLHNELDEMESAYRTELRRLNEL